jgi:parvulin-like peptidyl-prolyl isomerase
MRSLKRLGWATLLLTLANLTAFAQEKVPQPAAGAAATVNGQPVPETAVQRGLQRVPPAKHAEVRPEILGYLIDNVLVDQYLLQLQVAVEPKEVEARLELIKADIQKSGKTFEAVLKEFMLTEQEIRAEVAADLRWDKFVAQQGTDKVLRELFDREREMFDGTQVRARHILLTPPSGDAKACEQAQAELLGFKKQVEQKVADGLVKLPAGSDNLAKEQARARLTDEAFADVAREKSACPSKKSGGDVGEFPRGGSMVEPFAKAAFALKPYQMSEVVKTQFGYHLILAGERRPGKEVKYEEVADFVKEVYADRLREAVLAQVKPKAKIVITPAAKP